MDMHGKIALVTGAGSGIGRATALRLAKDGARVACVDLAAAGVEATAKTIAERGGDAIATTADVTRDADCARAVAAAVSRFGGLTTLVNCAGVRGARPDTAPDADEWRRVVDVNLTGTYLASRAALDPLRAGGGAIVNISSIYGLVGGASSPAYAASKGGVTLLTRQMALDFAPTVRVNCVCPGVIETPMTAALREDPAKHAWWLARHPLGRFGQADDVAAAIVFLASDDAAYITGAALPVDGGYTAA